MIVQGKFLYFGDDLSKAFEIRKQVFQIEQGVSAKEEFDEIDDLAIHAIVYATDDIEHVVATGRVFYDGDNYRIGRIAVLKNERGRGYGDFVVRMLANKAFLSGANEVLIHAQVSAIPFYEKIGFTSFGDIFDEAGISHICMKLDKNNVCKKCNKMI